jgi:hypothetical protein
VTYAQTFHDGLVNLIAELKRDGRSERRIPLKNGKRKEVGALGAVYAFAWSDPAELIFEGARVAFQAGRDRQEATVVLVSPEHIVLQLARDLGEIIDTATIVVDQTAFLEALRRRMEDIARGRPDRTHNTLPRGIPSLPLSGTRGPQELPRLLEVSGYSDQKYGNMLRPRKRGGNCHARQLRSNRKEL